MLFLPQDPETAAAAATIVEKVVAAEGRCRIIGWRDVPHDAAVVGRMAKAEQPIIRQVQLPIRRHARHLVQHRVHSGISLPLAQDRTQSCIAASIAEWRASERQWWVWMPASSARLQLPS